jgi:hypothetical protein
MGCPDNRNSTNHLFNKNMRRFKMELYHSKVKGFEIKRRTFEGKTDHTKNDNSLTSKYMPSYKYWLRIEYHADEHHARQATEYCCRTKQEALDRVERAKYLEGKPL